MTNLQKFFEVMGLVIVKSTSTFTAFYVMPHIGLEIACIMNKQEGKASSR